MMAPLLASDRIQALEGILGYTFKDKLLLDKSLEAAGFSTTPEGNKRLAQVGDAALKLIFYLDGYGRNTSIGETAKLHDTRAANRNLTLRGFSKGVDSFIHVNPAQESVSDKLMATTVEAMIGAVSIDSEWDIPAIRNVVIELGLLEAS